jgi:hypothetical protein
MKVASVIHIYCVTCGYPSSARSLDSARESFLEHLQYATPPHGALQGERIRLLEAAQRVVGQQEGMRG